MPLGMGFTLAKEYAVKKTQPNQPKPAEESQLISQGARESGVEWGQADGSELNLMDRVSDSDFLLTTSTTDTSARVASSEPTSSGLVQDLRSKFKKMFAPAYANVFSHNQLLAKVAKWLVGNVMERLALVGMPIAELESLKDQVRSDLVAQNQAGLSQVVYDETMLEIVG